MSAAGNSPASSPETAAPPRPAHPEPRCRSGFFVEWQGKELDERKWGAWGAFEKSEEKVDGGAEN